MKIDNKFNQKDNCWEVSLDGELDINYSKKFKEEMVALLDENETNIKMDCQNLSYLDSTGLGCIIFILKRLKNNDKTITLYNAKPNIKKIINIIGLNKILDVK